MPDNKIKLHRDYTFINTIKEHNICIPPIQRDYVQGLETPTVNEIRKNFVHDLLEVVKGLRPSLKLDFVYGDTNIKGFVPLDGQQRLTTLFLLHWMLGVELIKEGKSCMTYDTRESSKDFCEALTQRKAIDFISEAKKKNCLPSKIIRGRYWFSWSWQFDPTVLAMLVMIDTLYMQLKDNTEQFELYRGKLQNIKYDYLPLEELGMTDELFVKMNARGKELSAFDKMKSTLEEEMQTQMESSSALRDTGIETAWRTDMDKRWIDLFWNRYAIKDSNVLENGVQVVEQRFYVFLLRMIGLQILETCNDETLRSISTKNLSGLKELLVAYHDSLVAYRSSDKTEPVPYQIDFTKLRDDINLLILESPCNTVYNSIDSKNCLEDGGNYFDMLSEDNINHSTLAIVYASILYLRKRPGNLGDEQHVKEFNAWMRFIRNVINDANNNDELSHIMRRVIVNLPTLLNDYLKGASPEKHIQGMNEKTYDGIEKDYLKGSSPIKCILGLDGKTYDGINNASLLEEIEKAQLINNGVLKEEDIREAENDKYLWGQIRCLLKWCNSDYSKFISYKDKLIKLLDYTANNVRNEYKNSIRMDIVHAVLLTYEEMDNDYWNQTYKNETLSTRTQARKNALYIRTNDKRFGLKRYLRDEENGYGIVFKRLLDDWNIALYNNVQDYLYERLKSYVTKDWRWCICQYPTILEWSHDCRCLYTYNGHVAVPTGNSTASICHDPILIYIENRTKEQFDTNWNHVSCVRYHSGATPSNRFWLKVGAKEFYVEWDNTLENSYRIVENHDEANAQNELTEAETINIAEDLIEKMHQYQQSIIAGGCSLSIAERNAIKMLYPGIEDIVDALLDNNIEFSHEGECDILDKEGTVQATAGLLLKKYKIAIDPDDGSEDIFKAAGYQTISSKDFDINMLKQ